ncbi:MAG TPA: CHAT domain-containing tetratricopeptide repeat protein [Thermoanaerobaculia bacterium]|nr:CHAT domain-containing tetratricopeptide repeat protein [Thermoanaerobaculia bacterium]
MTSMLLAPLLLAASLSAPGFVGAFERADTARLDALLATQPLRDRIRVRRLALDPRYAVTVTTGEDRLCLDVRDRGGMLVEQLEIDLDDGQVHAAGALPLPRARDLVHRGGELLAEGKFDEAVAALNAAAALTTHAPTRVSILQGLGHVAYLRNDIDSAARHFQECLEVARQANDPRSIAVALEALGTVDRFRGDLDRGEERIVDALRYFALTGDLVAYASTLGSQASVRNARGDYRGAQALHAEALALAEEIGEPTARLFSTISLGISARSLGRYRESETLLRRGFALAEADREELGIAYSYANLGPTLAALGQWPEAVQAFHKGLALKERLGRGESIILELSSLGEMYRRLGNDEQAAAQFEKGLALARKADFKIEIARGLHNLGRYEQALAIDREIGNRAGIARDLQSIGHARMTAGDHAAARRAFEESLGIAEEIGAREPATRLLAMLSQLDGSIEPARRALTIAEDLGLPEHLWYAHLALGRALRRAGLLRESRAELERAIAVVEELRRDVPGEESAQQQAFERLVEPYHELIALLVQQGDRAGALEYAERAKGRVLLDVLQNGRPDLGGVLTEAERAREAELTARLAALNRSGATKALRAARLEYDTFLTAVYAAHPELRGERGEVASLHAHEVPDDFIEFVVTKDRTFVFTAASVGTIEIGERALAAEIAHFRELLASRDLLYEPAARALYDRLLGRAARPLRGKGAICIVPDGPLWELPFHALQPAAGEFLIDRHAVYYAPSLSVLREMSPRHRATAGTRLLAFGNPILPGKRAGVHRDEPLQPLPHTETEIRAIAALYGANNSRLRLRADAREELVKKEAGMFDVLHFATHGILDDRNALYSRLVFSPASTPGEDGLLEAREILRLRLGARLAVLSACETARGRVGTGEGLIGMSWALFVAGVPSTVVSQWKVDSTSTTELMIELHRNLRAGRSHAEALRRAALKTRAKHPHPFYWAPFVVVGSAR